MLNTFRTYMGVDFGGVATVVPQKFLNIPQISAAFQQVCGKTVAQPIHARTELTHARTELTRARTKLTPARTKLTRARTKLTHARTEKEHARTKKEHARTKKTQQCISLPNMQQTKSALQQQQPATLRISLSNSLNCLTNRSVTTSHP